MARAISVFLLVLFFADEPPWIGSVVTDYRNAIAADEKYKGKEIAIRFQYGASTGANVSKDGDRYVLKLYTSSKANLDKDHVHCYINAADAKPFGQLKFDGPLATSTLIGTVKGRMDDKKLVGGYRIIIENCKLK